MGAPFVPVGYPSQGVLSGWRMAGPFAYVKIKFSLPYFSLSGIKFISKLREAASVPTILYSDKNTLPEISAVYIVRHNGIVLYVGSTIRLRTRFRRHHKKEFFKNEGTSIEYIECEIQWLGPLEVSKCKELQPTLNSIAKRPNRKQQPIDKVGGKAWYPFGNNNEGTSLRDRTIYLLNSNRDKSLKEIAEATNTSYVWLSAFSRGRSLNPGVNTVQKLYEYLTNSKLAV